MTLGMDVLALVLGALIGVYFVAGLALYILASRAYSYRGIRLKKYPIIGFITVVSCQGALVFFMVYQGCHVAAAIQESLQAPAEAMIACSLLLGGFYPLTQIYQHEADRKDGVRTLSLLLGYRGTFVFTGVVYTIAFMLLAHYFLLTLQIREFQVLATCMLPVVVYFLIWAVKVWKDPREASYSNTMRMNLIASACTNAGFIAVLVMGAV
ncbi:UbiA family prenyltransferase [Puia sp. P3]|uniref:UbiA family prenyltransferase n=1 Tax=Puia sp. P3 TaxID=3423952 RepID=UPI003D67DD98